MLRRKLATVNRILREKGLAATFDYVWFRVKFITLTRLAKKNVRIDGCTFSLQGVSDGLTKYSLLTNRYETPERQAVALYLRRDLPVIELGGSMGVVACVTNKLLTCPTAHVVVEANPFAIPHLQLNKERNGCQFEILNKAIAYGMDFVTFRPSSNMCANSITEDGDRALVTVGTIQLRDLVHYRGFDNFTLVCDIEGLEYDMVCHEADVLKKAHTIILETHARFIGEEKVGFMMNRLREIGFRFVHETGFVVILEHSSLQPARTAS